MRYFPILAFVTIIAAHTAVAAPVCVSCTGPARTYACETPAGDASKIQGAALICVRELAERYNHAACAVQRNQPCDGTPEIVGNEDLTPAPIQTPPVQPPGSSPQAGLPSGEDDNREEKGLGQKTLDVMKKSGEAVESAGRSVGNAVKTTGDAIGSAAKKTWTCLGSGLSDC